MIPQIHTRKIGVSEMGEKEKAREQNPEDENEVGMTRRQIFTGIGVLLGMIGIAGADKFLPPNKKKPRSRQELCNLPPNLLEKILENDQSCSPEELAEFRKLCARFHEEAMTQRDVSGNARGQYEHADLVRIVENEDALGRWLMLGIAAAMQQLNLRARRHAPLSEVCNTSPRGFLECDPNHLALMVAQIAEAEDLPLTLIGDNERNRLFIVNLNENRARDSSDSCTLYNFPDRPNQGTGLRPIFQEDQGRVIGETVSLSALYGSDNNRARFEPAPRDSEQFVTWATKFLEGPRHRTDLIAKQGSGTQPDHFKE